MHPVTVVALDITLASEFRTFLDELTSTEGRLAVSGAVLAVTIVVGGFLAPALVRRTTTFTQNRMPAGRTARVAERMGDLVPTTISDLFLRGVQAALLVTAVLSLLVIWGLVGVALDFLAVVGLSIPFLVKVGTTLALVAIAYGLADILTEAIDRFADGSDRITDHQREIILRAGNLGLIALFVSAGLTVWGVDLSGLLVGAGFLGIVVGLAARQTLGSLIAGFVLMFSRPFTIGDWIEVGEDEGIVTEITIMNTRMENFDGETIVIPNDRVNNQPIVNRSNRGQYRVRLDVGVDYDADLDHATAVAKRVLEETNEITDAPPPRVLPKSFGDSAIVLELRFWIDRPMPPRKWRAVESVVRGVKERFDREDITIPYPQRELSNRNDGRQFRMRESAKQPSTEDPVETSPD